MKKLVHKKSFLIWVFGGVAVLLLLSFFILLGNAPASIYVYPENPRQGDTVFVRVKAEEDKVSGKFDQEELLFSKKANSEWLALAGIDLAKEPGEYEIVINVGPANKISKKINVGLAEFSKATEVSAPSAAKTGISKEKAVDNIATKDGPALKDVLANFTFQPHFSSAFSAPLAKMQRAGYGFGQLISFGEIKLHHLGVDLIAQTGTPVLAVNDGKVVAILDLPNYGKTVIIDHGATIFSLYLHLSEFKVSQNEMVRRGQTIGLAGKTGYATAPHLHFSMRAGNSKIDPVTFIETSKKINANFFLADLSSAFLNLINSFK